MMLLAGTSRAVVPALRLAPGLLRAAALGAWAISGVPAGACPAVPAAAADELAELSELAEHPARNMPPPSRTLPIMTPAMTPGRVRPDRVARRVRLPVFSMPL